MIFKTTDIRQTDFFISPLTSNWSSIIDASYHWRKDRIEKELRITISNLSESFNARREELYRRIASFHVVINKLSHQVKQLACAALHLLFTLVIDSKEHLWQFLNHIFYVHRRDGQLEWERVARVLNELSEGETVVVQELFNTLVASQLVVLEFTIKDKRENR